MNESIWLELMERLGLEPNLETYNELFACYNEKHRFYHNVEHIKAVLNHLKQSNHLANDANAVEIALWFHDAIYKPFSSSNELDSADWASSFLKRNGASEYFAGRVHSLIMATLHDATPCDNDERLLVDIDLSILGVAPEIYEKFEGWIRKEYKFVPSFVYRKKRKEILKGFLEREKIYSHDYFFTQLEKPARENIARAIQNL